MSVHTATVLHAEQLTDGLYFGESPRWHDGKLYVSDMTGRKIYIVDAYGNKDVLVEVENQPNGMCFAADGSLIYSSMFDGKLYRYKDGKHELYADLSKVMTGYCGDMVIDSSGRVFMDDVGARVLHGEQPRPGRLLVVETNGEVKVAEENIVFPNGIVINNSGTQLYLAETFKYCLNRFEISPKTGQLSNRIQVWDPHELSDALERPSEKFSSIDGICMDAEDGIWLSMLAFHMFIRRDVNGNITHRIDVDGEPTACTLGGDDGKTLYLVINKCPEGEDLFSAMVGKRTRCSIKTVKVDVPHGRARP